MDIITLLILFEFCSVKKKIMNFNDEYYVKCDKKKIEKQLSNSGMTRESVLIKTLRSEK